MPSVLIVGATGFLGSKVLSALQAQVRRVLIEQGGGLCVRSERFPENLRFTSGQGQQRNHRRGHVPKEEGARRRSKMGSRRSHGAGHARPCPQRHRYPHHHGKHVHEGVHLLCYVHEASGRCRLSQGNINDDFVGNRNLIEAAARCKVKRFVLLSVVKVNIT